MVRTAITAAFRGIGQAFAALLRSKPRSRVRPLPKVLIVLVCGLIAACPLPAAADHAPPAGVYVYEIRHPVLGELGQLTNRVDREGARTTVDTELRIVARM